jgi:2'-5' RNA ligase
VGQRGKKEKMRLFIGIPLENEAQEALTSCYKEFKDAKTVKKENLHVTLQFMGDMEDDQIEPLKKAIDAACEGLGVFEITVTRISAFPTPRNAKVIWANVERGAGAVKILFKNLEKSLDGFKYEKEKRAFIPHITIARKKQGMDISAQAAFVKLEIQSRAGKVVLYSSVLEPDGPVYTKVYEKFLI